MLVSQPRPDEYLVNSSVHVAQVLVGRVGKGHWRPQIDEALFIVMFTGCHDRAAHVTLSNRLTILNSHHTVIYHNSRRLHECQDSSQPRAMCQVSNIQRHDTLSRRDRHSYMRHPTFHHGTVSTRIVQSHSHLGVRFLPPSTSPYARCKSWPACQLGSSAQLTSANSPCRRSSRASARLSAASRTSSIACRCSSRLASDWLSSRPIALSICKERLAGSILTAAISEANCSFWATACGVDALAELYDADRSIRPECGEVSKLLMISAGVGRLTDDGKPPCEESALVSACPELRSRIPSNERRAPAGVVFSHAVSSSRKVRWSAAEIPREWRLARFIDADERSFPGLGSGVDDAQVLDDP